MLPLLSRIFESLNKPVEGTDDIIEQTNMRKAYLSFILNLLNNRMESIFVSEGTSPHYLTNCKSTVQSSMRFSKASSIMQQTPLTRQLRRLRLVCSTRWLWSGLLRLWKVWEPDPLWTGGFKTSLGSL